MGKKADREMLDESGIAFLLRCGSSCSAEASALLSWGRGSASAFVEVTTRSFFERRRLISHAKTDAATNSAAAALFLMSARLIPETRQITAAIARRVFHNPARCPDNMLDVRTCTTGIDPDIASSVED